MLLMMFLAWLMAFFMVSDGHTMAIMIDTIGE